MNNGEIQVARKYHQATKHSLTSVQNSRHFLDWANQPDIYKRYQDVESIPLPVDLPRTEMPALRALDQTSEEREDESVPDLAELAYILDYTAGVTKKLEYTGGVIEFRAAAAAGALYPIEVYVICGDLQGLPAGVYHFGPGDFSLHRLRSGDYREFVAQASGGKADIAQAPLVLVLTAITWRSSWKYQARAYRYHYWDGGTLLANGLAACSALSLPSKVVLGFVDPEVDRLIGIDGEFEKSLALVPVGRSAREPGPSPEVGDLELSVEPISADWRPYPLIDEMHKASNLDNPAEVESWREGNRNQAARSAVAVLEARRFDLPEVDLSARPGKGIEDTIVRRGSSRRFRREALPFEDFSAILGAAATGFGRDWARPDHPLLNQVFLNVHAVEGLAAGSYLYLPEEHQLALLREGDFRSESAYLCLGQELGGDASVTIFFLADLEPVLEKYGNRGYRAAQLEAGILGGKMYLASYAHGRGASGLTFFDDDVVAFFSPAAAGMETIFVTAIGLPARPARRTGRMTYLGPGQR